MRRGELDGVVAAACAAEQIGVVRTRASERGEPVPDVGTVIDRVVAPMIYRIPFRPDGLDAAYAHRLVAGVLGHTPGSARERNGRHA